MVVQSDINAWYGISPSAGGSASTWFDVSDRVFGSINVDASSYCLMPVTDDYLLKGVDHSSTWALYSTTPVLLVSYNANVNGTPGFLHFSMIPRISSFTSFIHHAHTLTADYNDTCFIPLETTAPTSTCSPATTS